MKKIRSIYRDCFQNFALIVLLITVVAQVKATPPDPETGKTYALIIGISDYKNVEGLEFANRDAQEFAAFLQSKSGGEVSPDNIKMFLNSEATAVNIGSAIEQFHKQINKGDQLFFFFAGHGDMEESNANNGLLLLYNAPASSYWAFGDDYLEVNKLKQISENFSDRGVEMFIITDACRSGHLSGGADGVYATSMALKERWSNEIKILSCQPNEFSQEGKQWGGGHGVFTYYLIEGLYGLANENTNEDQCVNVMEIENYLRKLVIRDAAPARQTPLVSGDRWKTINCYDDIEYANVAKQKEGIIPTMDVINTKGLLEQMLSGQDSLLARLYVQYKLAVDSGWLIFPEGESASDYYTLIMAKLKDEQIARTLKRNFAAALQQSSMDIIEPVLQLESFKRKDAEEYQITALELSKAIELLGEYHFLTDKLKIRKLFIEAYALCGEFEKTEKEDNIQNNIHLNPAKELLLEAIAIDSNVAYPYFQLGWIYNKQSDSEKAAEIYQKYFELVPNNKRAYNNLGYAYNDLGEYDKAIGCFEKVIALDSAYALPYNNIGMSYASQEKYNESVSWFEMAIKRDSAYAEPYYNLGNVYIYLNDYENAKLSLNKYLQMEPDDYWAYYILADIGSLEKNKAEALKNLEKAFKLGFDNEAWMNQDSDLDNIRETLGFKRLMEKYFKK